MPFIGNKPSAVPLTSADIADGIITSAKIVDGTILNADINASSAIAISKIASTGTSLQVLRMNTGATALEFATPSSGGMTLLSTTTLSSTTTSINITSTGYIELLISIENMTGATGDTKFNFNSDTGSNYKSIRMVGDASENTGLVSQSQTGVFINQNGSAGYTSASLLSCIINVYFPASTSRHKTFLSNTVGEYSSGRIAMLTSGIWKDTSAITSFQLISGTGTFSGGTVYIYGVK